MNYEKCYFDEDLRIYYFNNNDGLTDEEKVLPIKSNYESYYRITWHTGKSTVFIDKERYQFNTPIICFAPPYKPLRWISQTSPFEIIRIELSPKLYSNTPKCDDVLNFFYNLHGRQMIFDLTEPQNSNLNTMIELLKSALFSRSGRFHIETRVNAIISEMCMIYEYSYTEYIASTDSIPVQIVDFINKNYTSNITLDTIKDKFFVSKPTIIAIVKKITGDSFKQYLTKLRLKDGKHLLENSDLSATQIAQLCGFNEYSAFYKAFKKEYGYPPKEITRNQLYSFPLK